MKARVKATGEIIEVESEPYIANDRLDIGIRFTDNDGNIYREYQLDFEDLSQVQKKMQESNEGQALLYAVEKTAERTKKEVIKKAAEWFEKYLFDIGYPDDWCRDSRVLVSGRDRFIKAMQDESK